MSANETANKTAGPAAGATAPLSALASGWRWLPLVVVVIAIDQWVKGLIVKGFVLGESRFVLPVFDIVRAHNYGAAFSFLDVAGGQQRWLFTALAVVVSIAILVWLRRIDARSQAIIAAGLAFIFGGAIGNAIDRLQYGYVVDFILVHWGKSYFPAFNVADSAITVGAGLLILDALLEWQRERKRSAPGGGSASGGGAA